MHKTRERPPLLTSAARTLAKWQAERTRPQRRHMRILHSTVFAATAASLVLLALPAGRLVAADTPATHAGLEAAVGQRLFKRNWVPAPSSTKSNDGLGPLFNARSCQQCHAAATAGQLQISDDGSLVERGAVVRLARPSGEPDPVYGAQIQTRAVQNHRAESSVHVTWTMHDIVLEDGSRVTLRRPSVSLLGLDDGLAADSQSALVLAPSLAIAAQIARVDAQALARLNSTTGRLSTAAGGEVLVFGRKATESSLAHAIETAFARDLGMSAGRHTQPAGDCTAQQTACLSGPHGDDGTGIEIAPQIVSMLSAYVASLAPATQAVAGGEGEAVFAATGCTTCHQPASPGKDGKPVTLYSDLRLHDMGADLAGFAEAQGQTASEWRTSPLVGLKSRLAAGSTLLHDGRARTVEEAVLWHGGQAQGARDAYTRLSSGERKALQDFVASR